MSVTTAVEPTLAVAQYVHDLSYANLPAKAVANAKLAILDTLGVILLASRQPVGKLITDYVGKASSTGPSRVIGSSLRTCPEHAALANGVMAHGMDFDDRGHSSTHVLSTALALADAQDASGQQLVLSYVAGREVRMHLNEEFDRGRFEGRGPGSRGWHATGTLGTMGSTAAGAKLLGLGVEQTRWALGISGSLLGGIAANWGTMTKPMHAGNAARNGVLASTLAASGFTGEPTVLSAPWGVVDALCLPGECEVENVSASLRDSLHIVKHGIRIKPYPSCTGTHGYIETIKFLREKYNLVPEAVKAIRTTRAGPLIRLYPKTDLECKFSAGYAVVVTLIEGTFTQAHCSESFLNRPDVQGLMAKLTYVGEPEKDQHVEIEMVDGQVHEMRLLPVRDLTTYEEIQGKFLENAVPVLGEARAKRVEALVADLEQLRSVRELTGLLD